MTLSGGIAVAGIAIGAGYAVGELLKALSNRGQSRDDARSTAIKVGLEQGVLDQDDVFDILDDVTVDEKIMDDV